jgi:general secretion pathway protein A
MTRLKKSGTPPAGNPLEFFNLSRNPFPVAPDNTDFYMSQHNEAVIKKLTREILSRKGFMLLTGDVGLGKTTISRRIIQILEQHQVETALIFQSFFQGTGLLKEIIKDFGMATEEIRADLPTLMNLLNDFLLQKNREGVNCAILIDDAQNLSIESLELIRMISNLEADREKLVQIILVGQPELLEKINSHELRQLKSRVAIRQNPVPLEKSELGKYIQFKLNRAGDSGRITLMPKALDRLYRLTGGNPRKINILMDRALHYAFDESTAAITPRHIKNADREMALDNPARKASFLNSSFVIFLLILIIFGMAGGSILFLRSSAKNQPAGIETTEAAPSSVETTPPAAPDQSPAAQETEKNDIKAPISDSVTGFLSAYGIESFSLRFQEALDQKNLTAVQAAIFDRTGLRLIRLSALPDSIGNKFDILSRIDKDSQKTEYLLFWKPSLTITKFYSGYKGEEISDLQRILYGAGLYDYNIDGIVGQIIMKSVKDFQIQNHLQPTGFPDPETVFLLANTDMQ